MPTLLVIALLILALPLMACGSPEPEPVPVPDPWPPEARQEFFDGCVEDYYWQDFCWCVLTGLQAELTYAEATDYGTLQPVQEAVEHACGIPEPWDPAAPSICGEAIDALSAPTSDLHGANRYHVNNVYFGIPEGYTFRLAVEPGASDPSAPDYTITILSGNSRLVIDPDTGEEWSRRAFSVATMTAFDAIIKSVCIE